LGLSQGPFFFRARILKFTEHRPVTDKLLNTEYEKKKIHRTVQALVRRTYIHTYKPTYDATVICSKFAAFFSFLILYTVGKSPWMEDQPVARPLPTHRTTQTQNKRTQTFML
jgi:hypothetical protein